MKAVQAERRSVKRDGVEAAGLRTSSWSEVWTLTLRLRAAEGGAALRANGLRPPASRARIAVSPARHGLLSSARDKPAHQARRRRRADVHVRARGGGRG